MICYKVNIILKPLFNIRVAYLNTKCVRLILWKPKLWSSALLSLRYRTLENLPQVKQKKSRQLLNPLQIRFLTQSKYRNVWTITKLAPTVFHFSVSLKLTKGLIMCAIADVFRLSYEPLYYHRKICVAMTATILGSYWIHRAFNC